MTDIPDDIEPEDVSNVIGILRDVVALRLPDRGVRLTFQHSSYQGVVVTIHSHVNTKKILPRLTFSGGGLQILDPQC